MPEQVAQERIAMAAYGARQAVQRGDFEKYIRNLSHVQVRSEIGDRTLRVCRLAVEGKAPEYLQNTLFVLGHVQGLFPPLDVTQGVARFDLSELQIDGIRTIAFVRHRDEWLITR
jgi:hypothetical protein